MKSRWVICKQPACRMHRVRKDSDPLHLIFKQNNEVGFVKNLSNALKLSRILFYGTNQPLRLAKFVNLEDAKSLRVQQFSPLCCEAFRGRTRSHHLNI